MSYKFWKCRTICRKKKKRCLAVRCTISTDFLKKCAPHGRKCLKVQWAYWLSDFNAVAQIRFEPRTVSGGWDVSAFLWALFTVTNISNACCDGRRYFWLLTTWKTEGEERVALLCVNCELSHTEQWRYRESIGVAINSLLTLFWHVWKWSLSECWLVYMNKSCNSDSMNTLPVFWHIWIFQMYGYFIKRTVPVSLHINVRRQHQPHAVL